MIYKTPGVFIKEINTFPPSVVPVETAIPAFVGYTEKAIAADGSSLILEPTRIESLLDFITYFGGDYQPVTYTVELNTTTNAIGAVTPDRQFYLYGCLRHFYANGGGTCYIVSVGDYSASPILGEADATPPTGLAGGLSRLEQVDEPTLLVFPDGTLLDAPDAAPTTLGSLQIAALTQCETLQDRFAIMDLHQGSLTVPGDVDPIGGFRNSIGTNSLKYGAAYYPWLQTIYRPDVNFRQLNFVDEVPAPISEDDLNTLISGPNADAINALMIAARDTNAAVETVVSAVTNNVSTVLPNLNRDNFTALSEHFATLVELLRQVPSLPTEPTEVPAFEAAVRERFSNLLLLARTLALALPALDDIGDPPVDDDLPVELEQAITSLQAETNLREAITNLIALEKNASILNAVASDRTPETVDTAYTNLSETLWLGPAEDVTVASILPNEMFGPGADLRLTALNAAAVIQVPFETIAAAVLSLYETAVFLADEAETQLFNNHPVMKAAVDQVQKVMSTLPCSGAVAGIYATTDRLRGVWKAPANVSVADVVGPAVKLNDTDQADLNVHTTGKSINAIRAFTGKGTLVWGARTLAGNDNEWRYVPVRRFFNMAEESIKKATEAFVFEPNDANTWVRVRAMIENFLTLQWRAGALAGAKTEQAFFVKVGLGETMTAQDILEGRMIVEIGMAVVRPAEFIILKFSHKMQVS